MGTKYKSKLLQQTHTLEFPDLSVYKRRRKNASDKSFNAPARQKKLKTTWLNFFYILKTKETN